MLKVGIGTLTTMSSMSCSAQYVHLAYGGDGVFVEGERLDLLELAEQRDALAVVIELGVLVAVALAEVDPSRFHHLDRGGDRGAIELRSDVLLDSDKSLVPARMVGNPGKERVDGSRYGSGTMLRDEPRDGFEIARRADDATTLREVGRSQVGRFVELEGGEVKCHHDALNAEALICALYAEIGLLDLLHRRGHVGGARTILVVDEVGIERRGGDRGADVDHVEVFGLLEIGPDDVALRPLELEGEVERAEHGDHEDGDDERRYRLAESRSSHT